MSVDLVLDHDLDATGQFIEDANRNPSALCLTSDKVGIGTTAPGEMLSVAGMVESTGGFKFPDGTVQITAAGVVVIDWIRQLGSATDDYAKGVAIDSQGHVFITGYTYGQMGQDPSAGSFDAWLAKYDGDGNQIWIEQLGSASSDYAQGVAVDSQGHVFITGFTYGQMGQDPSAGSNDAWLAKLTVLATAAEASPWTVNGSSIHYDAGNVGIGTATPGATLEVRGDVRGGNSDANYTEIGHDGNNGYLNKEGAGRLDFRLEGNTKMSIAPNGNVGIGVTNPGQPLAMSSGARCTSGGVWTNASSRDVKDNVRHLTTEAALDALDDLAPVQFTYKADPDEAHLGFIAEDVPALVASKDRKGLSPMDIVAVLTKALQAQQQKIAELETRLNEQVGLAAG